MSGAEAQARRYLRWFPGWMRADRGEEAVGLVLDLLPPGAERLPLRARVDLVRAGLHARRVGIPPVKVWWSVVSARPQGRSRPVPPSWRPWLISWLASPRWRGRYAATCSALPVGVLLVFAALAWRDGRADVLLSPAWFALFGGWVGWRGGEEWRTTVSTVNGLDPVSLGVLPDGARQPVVVRGTARNGRVVDRFDAVLWWCALVVVLSAAWAAVWAGGSWGAGPAIAGVLVGGLLAATAAATVVMGARSLANRPAPASTAVERLPSPSGDPGWVLRAMLVVLVGSTIGLFELFAAGAAVATVPVVLVARHRLRAIERSTGHEVTVWGLFPWSGPSVRWIEPSGEDPPRGPTPA